MFVVLRQRRIRWDQDPFENFGSSIFCLALLQNRYLVRVKAKSTSFSCCTWRKKDTLGAKQQQHEGRHEASCFHVTKINLILPVDDKLVAASGTQYRSPLPLTDSFREESH